MTALCRCVFAFEVTDRLVKFGPVTTGVFLGMNSSSRSDPDSSDDIPPKNGTKSQNFHKSCINLAKFRKGHLVLKRFPRVRRRRCFRFLSRSRLKFLSQRLELPISSRILIKLKSPLEPPSLLMVINGQY